LRGNQPQGAQNGACRNETVWYKNLLKNMEVVMENIELKELEQLKLKEKELRKELSTIVEKIDNYNYQELEKRYGDKFTCDYCRYDCVYDFSGDGWHNLCGHTAAPCTCCNANCEYYKPDTWITRWIKDYAGQLDIKYRHAFETLGIDIFKDSLTNAETEYFLNWFYNGLRGERLIEKKKSGS
jgi:hypothetical protein